MKLKTKRIDKSLPLPDYEKGAACFDFVCREDVTIGPGKIELVPLNVVIRVPDGYALLVFARSSTSINKGLVLANGVGVVDSFYCGDKDEIVAAFYNFASKKIQVKKGERLAQGMLIRHEVAQWSEVENMGAIGRGGYESDLWRPDKR